jgi:hypothetical protein
MDHEAIRLNGARIRSMTEELETVVAAEHRSARYRPA